MKGYHITDGLMKRMYVPISRASALHHKYADGTELFIPKECCTRTGMLRAGVAKAILLKDYTKLISKYGVIVKKGVA